MTMQGSGPISMGQAMNECQVGGRYNAGSSVLSKLAGVSPGQRYAWHYWYGKSFGTQVTEYWTQYFDQNMTGANNVNFGYSLVLYHAGNYNFMTGWGGTGGQDVHVGNYPPVLTNGFNISGFYRIDNYITVLACNCSLDGVTFQSSIGDNVRLTNDISYSFMFGGNLWTFYAAANAVAMGGPRTYTVNLIGPAVRPQPPNGYVNGVAPASGTGSGGPSSTSHHCFPAGALVMMANESWQPVERIRAGDMLMGPYGPVMAERLHVAALGSERGLMTFREDSNHVWTSDHPHWARQNGQQWWWSGQPEYWRRSMDSGLITGLRNPDSFFSGSAEFAHLQGFVKRSPQMLRADPQTPVYLPVVQGSPIIVNGYLTGGFINDQAFDYQQLDWLDCLQLPA